MSAQSAKKPLLRKETLRQLDTAQLGQLEGAVGGITPTIVSATLVIAATVAMTRDSGEG
ncbi:hypothetical protein [Comamonas sp. JC664]|uniref:hypothetical protein n=1 Tax=Comamonas sp. JC664 TaxID=2801917 RepID=UPI00174B914E|nr:hypothetical protein [Comamonas sp. JC664]MBL0697711.1 hypothetical protein [Comamonas sp. JC664]GHG69142.1 hypothetical protein GCM10012319_13040 [Comamonas sp. KCTC 72670]